MNLGDSVQAKRVEISPLPLGGVKGGLATNLPFYFLVEASRSG